MVTAYNWQYILARITDKVKKERLETRLENYLQSQLSTLPRTVDLELGMQERFANLKTLLRLLKDLPNQVAWSKDYVAPTKKPLKKPKAA